MKQKSGKKDDKNSLIFETIGQMTKIESPSYVLEQAKLEKNLSLIKSVCDRAEVEIILAFKAYALWKTFPIITKYIPCSTASSLWEARLAYEEMGMPAHTFSPIYKEEEMHDILRYSSHITFNSLTQFEKYIDEQGHCKMAEGIDHKVSFGIRINPEYSPVETALYNPCSPGSRFGILAEELPEKLPAGIEGFHCHVLCESDSRHLIEQLKAIERHFGKYLDKLKWLNLGGGHLMTREGYDIELLIKGLTEFKQRHPNLKVILEPGSAFGWQTGYLLSRVMDIVENKGIKTAILDVSFTCHMPDCLEMPYKPVVRGAYQEPVEGKPTYRLGGCSCLAGDFLGDWSFDKPLHVGDTIIFEDMLHYTTVKTTMFNGVHHPSFYLINNEGEAVLLRKFEYEDYKSRMD